ncbi:MAG: inorganic phosphate transporter [Flavobacteriaceae bacterium]|nr:inorganic phosphate transporter [Flavobacteriaceae bacterium LSUCC0859]
MDNLYLLMLVALAALAIADLIVGVSNDAVNFLNSAVGSKAISFKTIMIVASIGIALGAIFSSGMMEVARKGIFNPGEFYFNEIMFIFMAVMITDILLLDFFNTIGLPTSTTVSIVFELLGASVAMALIKIYKDGGRFEQVVEYINTSKATEIIIGILLSVAIAFTVGALVQWATRVLLSFNFEKKPDWMSALFGGLATSSITYFILMKGIKGTAFASRALEITNGQTLSAYIESHVGFILLINLSVWFLVSFLLITLFKVNIYRFIIVIGTFALALAFAGNDLVNFIGVPIAAMQSYDAWVASGVAASDFSMNILSSKVPTPTLLLFISGGVMVATLWLSKKARYVAETEINLAREGESKERFNPNALSRIVVRLAINIGELLRFITPNSLQEKFDKQFTKAPKKILKGQEGDAPAFDMVRAAVNLVVAGILISIATSFKLPLSTTYVTFMVAMGTSLSDRAWGAESAVYRVAGVLNVIGGWFGTAIIAFTAASIILSITFLGQGIAVIALLIVAVVILFRNYLSYNQKTKEIKQEDRLRRAESSSIQGVIEESANNISNVIRRSKSIYANVINGLAKQDLDLLKKNKKSGNKLADEIEDLRNHIFYFIKNLDESSMRASDFYIATLKDLTDASQSLDYISKVSHKHVNNNHKKLKYNQLKELKEIESLFEKELFDKTKTIFETRAFNDIIHVLNQKETMLMFISQKIETQVGRIRTEETSPKNSTLYFSILTETRDLLNAIMNLLEMYYKAYDEDVTPATIDED